MNRSRFLRYQSAFYQKVNCSPYEITLRKYSVRDSSDLDTFLGDSSRSFKEYILPVLYEKTVNPRIREKYGLPDTIDSIVFISPIQIAQILGGEKINKNTFTVILEGHEQVISNITYLEPIFGSYISLRLDLKDALKGG